MGRIGKRLRFVLLAIATAAMLGALPTLGATSASALPPPTFDAHGSAEQVYVTGLPAGQDTSLLSSGGATIATQRANPLGGLLFRNVTPGSGYRVKNLADSSESAPLTVYSNAPAPWDPSIYNQTINSSGYQYLTTRDGTQLALDVHLPSGKGPFPTLIEYAGYGYTNPAGPQSGISVIANLMGFAVVDVNIRGTGCSGGAFDFFEPLQQLDGYDVIETIAHQPWVLNNKVGMFGISYGGISQLFTAQNNPPSLAAITPMSVLDTSATTLYPGGILNNGFALSWAQGRVDDAQPAGPHRSEVGVGPDPGRRHGLRGKPGAARRGGRPDREASGQLHYDAATADPVDPVTFVHNIHVPVFMACQWQDEQTGGHCPELVQHMTGTDKKWFTFTNGAHIDSLDPATLNRMFDFLELYVAKRAPTLDKATIRSLAPLLYQQALGVPNTDSITLPGRPDPGRADVRRSACRVREAADGPSALQETSGHLAHG